LREAAEKLYEEMRAKSLDVLFDAPRERSGSSSKTLHLIGVPYRGDDRQTAIFETGAGGDLPVARQSKYRMLSLESVVSSLLEMQGR